MRMSIGLALLAVAGRAHAATTCTGTGFYPPGDHPNSSLAITATLTGKQIAPQSARIGLDPLPTTLVLNPRNAIAAKYLAGMTKNLLDLEIALGAGGGPTHGEVTIYYPYSVPRLPAVTLQTGAGVQRVAVRRDPTQPKLLDVYADFAIPPRLAPQFRPGGAIQLKVYDASGALIEQASFRMPDAAAFQRLAADAHDDLKKQCEMSRDLDDGF